MRYLAKGMTVVDATVKIQSECTYDITPYADAAAAVGSGFGEL